jgi:hypothetical protein
METARAIEASKPRKSQWVAGDDDVLLTSAQVRSRLGGVSNMAIWRWQRDPRVKFPQPDMVMNSRRYWYLGTIRLWQSEREGEAA